VAEPKGKKHDGVALLYIPDIFGIWQNSQLMADQFAENGYHTIIIDVFNGDKFPNPPPADIMKWFVEGTNGDNPHTKEAVDPIVETALKYLKEQGFTKIGALGYCFGAKVSRSPVSPTYSSLLVSADDLILRLVRCPPLQGRHPGRLRRSSLLRR
jgi:dienelactone hydrolase